MSNDEEQRVTIITGRVWCEGDSTPEIIHVLLVAPDDDTAVTMTLEALAEEGYAEAELDQIGELQDAPDEEPHLSAWQGALEGEIAIVSFGPDET